MAHKLLSSLFFIGILFFSSARLLAQTQHNFSGWGALFTTYKLNSKFSIHFDGQARSADEWKRLQSFLIRPGLNYRINNNMIATVGYAYIGQYRTIESASGWAPEHRIWEQYIINQSFSPAGHATSLQHRFRLEQRFISKSIVDANELKTDGYNFAQRLRYFARFIFPLKQTTAFKKGMFVSLQDEVFMNIVNASATNNNFFDQNRAYVSVGYRTSPKFDIEVGYMNQFVVGRVNNIVNNIIQVATYIRL